MSSGWADVDLQVLCDSKEEAEKVVSLVANGDLSWSIEASIKDPSESEKMYKVDMSMKNSEVYRSFDDDLEALWQNIYEATGKKMTGKVLEEVDGYRGRSDFSEEGGLEFTDITFLELLTSDQIKEVRKYVEEKYGV